MMEEHKTEALLTLLQIKQGSLTAMRERVIKIVTTAITLFMLFVGWMVQKASPPSLAETISLVCIILVFWKGHLLILQDIRKGFIGAHNIVLRVEQCLDFYKPNAFHDDGKTLLPEKWQTSIEGGHFKMFENLLSAAALVSIVLLVMKYFSS